MLTHQKTFKINMNYFPDKKNKTGKTFLKYIQPVFILLRFALISCFSLKNSSQAFTPDKKVPNNIRLSYAKSFSFPKNLTYFYYA